MEREDLLLIRTQNKRLETRPAAANAVFSHLF